MIGRRSFIGAAASAAVAQTVFASGSAPAGQSKVRELERRLFDRINEVRIHSGVPPLQWIDGIWREASQQSVRKAILKFPGHIDPERGDIAQRLTSAGVVWFRCGENLFSEKGYDDPVNLAVVSWWYSRGHRENLLNPDYSQSAIGIAIDPERRIFATQIFVEPPFPQSHDTRTQKSPAKQVHRARGSEVLKRLFGGG